MKTQNANPRGKAKFTEDQLTNTQWTKLIPEEIWMKLVLSMNFAGEYPKGTPTTTKHITYHHALGKIAEIIRINNKSRFRTETELFKIALHLGMQILYHVFCVDEDVKKNVAGAFFYEAFHMVGKRMERATMIAMIDEQMGNLQDAVRAGHMDPADAEDALATLANALPAEHKDYIKSYFLGKSETNVTNIKSTFRKKFATLMK